VLRYNVFIFLFKGLSFCIKHKDYIKTSAIIPKVNRKKKLRKISGFVSIRVFQLSLENIICYTCKRFLSVSIHNIFLSKGLHVQQKLGVKMRKQKFRSLFYLVLMSALFNQSKIIALYLAVSIKTTKNHLVVLRSFIDLVEFFFFKRILRFLGFQLRLTGKLGGKMRRSKFHYKLGKVCLQTISIGLSYSTVLSYTKFGVISIKV